MRTMHENAPPLPERGEGRGEGTGAHSKAEHSSSLRALALTLSLSPLGERGRVFALCAFMLLSGCSVRAFFRPSVLPEGGREVRDVAYASNEDDKNRLD